MQVNKIQIRNILGIDSLEFKPGKITVISGKNKAGKTSFLEAIKGAVGGGHDAKLLRNGEDEGETVLFFDDGSKLTKTMTADKSKLTFEDAGGKKMKIGATYLKDIIDPVGLNPIQILTADPKTRIKMLLSSVPMEMPVDEIKFITGLNRSDKDGHPLAVIEEIRKDIFEERAFANKAIAEKNVMVSNMRETIPFKEDKKDWASQVGTLRTELEGLVKSHDEDVIKAQADSGNKQNAIREEAAKKREEADTRIAYIQAELNDELTKEREAFQSFLDKRRCEYNEESNPVKEKITEADINSKNQYKISGALEYVVKGNKEIELLEKDVAIKKGNIDDLDKLKGELMENLPVKDLKVYAGDIYIEDIPFDTLNEAAKIRFCLMIAGLRKTKLPLVCVDGLEAMDEKTFKIFEEEAAKTDMQFFVTRVSDEEGLNLK